MANDLPILGKYLAVFSSVVYMCIVHIYIYMYTHVHTHFCSRIIRLLKRIVASKYRSEADLSELLWLIHLMCKHSVIHVPCTYMYM